MATIDPKLTERIAHAIADVRAGKMVILVDDEDRENEGDLTMVGQFVTPEAINFMATHGRGLICLALTEEQIDRLKLPMMESPGRLGPPLGTAFTVSIEARLMSLMARTQILPAALQYQGMVAGTVNAGKPYQGQGPALSGRNDVRTCHRELPG